MLKVLLLLSVAFASVCPAVGQDFQKCVNTTTFHFIDEKHFDFSVLEPLRLEDENATTDEHRRTLDLELADLIRLQRSRTPREVEQANQDAGELDIFIFRSVIGDQFSASNTALSATNRLSQDLCEESTALATRQKYKFKRPRPFLVDKAIQPATDVSHLNTPSYPSGHALTGYLEALALADIFPAKRDLIIERAMEFARERNLLGVHYISDIAAGRFAAYALYAQISASPAFKKELEAARKELVGKF